MATPRRSPWGSSSTRWKVRGTFQRVDELPQGDLLGVAIEGVPAAYAAMRRDHLALMQRLEHLGDHRQGEVIERRNLTGGDHFPSLAGEVNGGKKAVVGE